MTSNDTEEAEDSQMKGVGELLEYAGRPVDGLTDEELLEAYREVEVKRAPEVDDPLARSYLVLRSNTIGDEIMARGKSLTTEDGTIQYYEDDDAE